MQSLLYPTSDPADSAAVSTAQGGISTAEGAIANIAKAILTGQQASATDRDNVEAGLNQVLAGLGNITSYVLSTHSRALVSESHPFWLRRLVLGRIPL